MQVKVKSYKCQKCTCKVDANRVSIWAAQRGCAKGLDACGMRDILVQFNKHQSQGIILLQDKREKPHLTRVKPPEKKAPTEPGIEFDLPDPIYIVIRPNGKVKHK